ncbi:hypothetical protein [Leifsonia sp. EB34]|uniref:hypothetical protein n=1 Tax=Leifsonia sp. EB34 TaxID=3156303 RepID=UPI00351621DD
MTGQPMGASRVTLTWGGAALVLATVVPSVAELVWVFPPPGTSWLYVADTPGLGAASAVVLIIAFVVLAFGVRGEGGIAGSSRVGRAALVVFALTSVMSFGYVSMNLTVVAVNEGQMAVASILLWARALVHVVALVVAALAVFRAGVLTGPDRWALPILAVLLIGTLVLSRIPLPVATGASIWGLVAFQLGLLLTGVLFFVQGLRSPRVLWAPAVPAG